MNIISYKIKKDSKTKPVIKSGTVLYECWDKRFNDNERIAVTEDPNGGHPFTMIPIKDLSRLPT